MPEGPHESPLSPHPLFLGTAHQQDPPIRTWNTLSLSCPPAPPRILKNPTSFPPQRAQPPSSSCQRSWAFGNKGFLMSSECRTTNPPEPKALLVVLEHEDFLSFWSKDLMMAMEDTAKHSSVIVSPEFLTLVLLLCNLPHYLISY